MSETQTSEQATQPSSTSKLVSASALMAAGTLTSRVLGFGRLMLLVVLFGNGTRQADMFTFANTVPNSMYILLAGGVLNTVLVPQIVRAIRGDADGGEAYTNRIMTAGLIILAAITVALTVAAPLIIQLYTPAGWHTPSRAPQYASMVTLAYYCLPQVFFYGVHVLAGQVLNARDKFGPMMWAPIANNVISILVLVLFLLVFGEGDRVSAFSRGEELLLGLGSTLGIAAQAAVLLPFLRAAGYRFRPRFDFKNAGLGHTFRLAKWTLGFVLVTQAALVVVYRLAGSATANGRGAGLTVYSNAYAIWILPHSLITLSLATVMLPTASRLAAAGDLAGVREETMRTMRLATAALLPTAVALIALGQPIAQLAFGFGQGARDAHLVGWALMALALGLVPFTVQYVCLRAYFALEDTRTTFFLQLVISGLHVLLALTVVSLLQRPSLVATALALAYAGAYGIGVCISFRVLGRRLPGLNGRALLRHCFRLLLAVLPAGLLAFGMSTALRAWSDSRSVLLLALVAAGAVAVPVFLLMARLLRITEVSDIVGTFLRRRRPVHVGAAGRPAAKHDSSRTAPADADDPGSPGDSPVLDAASSPTIETDNVTPGRSEPDRSEPGGRSQNTLMQNAPVQNAPVQNAESMVSQPPATDATIALTTRPTIAAPPPNAPPVPPAAAAIPAGTVLARRYRLEELLAGSPATVTWRAFDQVLSRSVLVHLLPPQDPKAADLLTAARSASAATDSRFLRVLDAVYSDRPDLGSYIVCEYATGQSLQLILSSGPLSGLEAAWIVREVADALSGVHAAGLYHRRVNPETVIVTPTGNVKIVGLMIEAALKPNPTPIPQATSNPELADVLDLGRLLYAGLVARWPGGPAFGLPAAPLLGRRWMTPRQVRAGVSPALDVVADQILGEPPRHRAPLLTTADDVVNALTKVLGTADASGDLERRLRQPIPRVNTPRSTPVSSLLDQPTQDEAPTMPIPRSEPTPQTDPTVAFEAPTIAPHSSSPVSAMSSTQPHPWQTTRVRQPPPPTAQPRSLRRQTPATGSSAPTSSGVRPPSGPGTSFRPVARSATVRRARRGRVSPLVLLALGLVVVGLVSALVLGNGAFSSTPSVSPTTVPNGSGSPSSSSDPSAAPVRIAIQGGRDFDPQGNPDSEHPELVDNAYDGSTKTRWRTFTYRGNPRLGGLKRGVGLVLDLGRAQQITSVKVLLSGSGTALQLRVPEQDPETIDRPPMSSDARWRVVGKEAEAKKTAILTPDEPVTSRFVLIYLTSLPRNDSGYQGGIYEVEVYA